jgi:hypothetical protein
MASHSRVIRRTVDAMRCCGLCAQAIRNRHAVTTVPHCVWPNPSWCHLTSEGLSAAEHSDGCALELERVAALGAHSLVARLGDLLRRGLRRVLQCSAVPHRPRAATRRRNATQPLRRLPPPPSPFFLRRARPTRRRNARTTRHRRVVSCVVCMPGVPSGSRSSRFGSPCCRHRVRRHRPPRPPCLQALSATSEHPLRRRAAYDAEHSALPYIQHGHESMDGRRHPNGCACRLPRLMQRTQWIVQPLATEQEARVGSYSLDALEVTPALVCEQQRTLRRKQKACNGDSLARNFPPHARRAALWAGSIVSEGGRA